MHPTEQSTQQSPRRYLTVSNAGTAIWLQANAYPFDSVSEDLEATRPGYKVWYYEDTPELRELLAAWRDARRGLFAASEEREVQP